MVFKWLWKKQHQSNNSDQSQQEHTARWTNQKCWQLPVNCSKRGENRVHQVRLVLVLPLIAWKTGAKFLSSSLSVTIAIASLLSTHSYSAKWSFTLNWATYPDYLRRLIFYTRFLYYFTAWTLKENHNGTWSVIESQSLSVSLWWSVSLPPGQTICRLVHLSGGSDRQFSLYVSLSESQRPKNSSKSSLPNNRQKSMA